MAGPQTSLDVCPVPINCIISIFNLYLDLKGQPNGSGPHFSSISPLSHLSHGHGWLACMLPAVATLPMMTTALNLLLVVIKNRNAIQSNK